MPVFPQLARQTGRPVNDLTGQRFGSYLVLRRGPDRSPFFRDGYKRFTTTWLCRCDCGREKTRSSQQVKAAKRCLYCHNATKYIPGIEATRRVLLRSYKQSAKARRIDWLLADKTFFKLTQSNCHYCGKTPLEEPRTISNPTQDYKRGRNNRAMPFNGIDRIDSAKPYVAGNVVTCCGICNHAKGRLKQETFLLWIARIRSTP